MFSIRTVSMIFVCFLGCQFDSTELPRNDSETGESTSSGGVTDSGDASGGTDSGVTDTGVRDTGGLDTGTTGGVVDCDPILPISQEFTLGQSLNNWYPWGGSNTNVILENEHVVIRPNPNINEYNGGGYRTLPISPAPDVKYDLEDGRVLLKVTKMVNTDEDIAFNFFVGEAAAYHYNLGQKLGSLVLRRRFLGESTQVLASIAYDPSQHIYWQLRQTDGVFFAEVGPSPDELTVLGSDVLDSAAKLEIVESSDVYFGVESNRSVARPGEAWVESVNVELGECAE